MGAMEVRRLLTNLIDTLSYPQQPTLYGPRTNLIFPEQGPPQAIGRFKGQQEALFELENTFDWKGMHGGMNPMSLSCPRRSKVGFHTGVVLWSVSGLRYLKQE